MDGRQDSDHLPGTTFPNTEIHRRSVSARKGSFSKDTKTEDTQSCGCIYQTLRRALIVMQMCGAAHSLPWIRSPMQSKCPWSPSKIYAIVVLVVVLHNPIRFFTVYDQSDLSGFQGFFLLKILFHAWYVINSINALLMFKLFNDSDKMKRFFAIHDSIRQLYDCGPKRFINRRSTIAIVVTLSFFAFNTIGYVFSMFTTPEFFYIFASSLTPFHRLPWATTSVPLKLLFCVNHIFATAMWLLPIMLLLIICFLIVNMEVTFNKKMASHLNDDGTFTGDLSKLRTQFLRICDIIETANEMFQNFFGFNIVIIIFNTCIAVYALANSTWLETNLYTAVFVLFWISNSLLALLILSYGAGIINDKAYEFIGVLHRIRRVDFSKGDEFELNMFLAKLNGPSIGFSAFDLFTIDKPSIMTVFGMVLSYLLFMVELSNGNGNSGSSSCPLSAVNATANATSP